MGERIEKLEEEFKYGTTASTCLFLYSLLSSRFTSSSRHTYNHRNTWGRERAKLEKKKKKKRKWQRTARLLYHHPP
jgi:hypothetical protein